MQLEDFLDFLAPNDIRIRGTRIGIETVLLDYLELGLFPEQIASRYRTLSIEQVYAVLTYYWHNRQEVDAYLQRIDAELEEQRAAQAANPSAAILRLREILQLRKAAAA